MAEVAVLEAVRDSTHEMHGGRDRRVIAADRAVERANQRFTDLIEDVDPFVVAGAPRLGIDAAATEWLDAQQETYRAQNIWTGTPPWPEFVRAHLAQHRGRGIVEASRDVDAIPPLFAGPTIPHGYHMRGQIIPDLAEIVGETLVVEAFEDHDAAAAIDYGCRLEQVFAEHAEQLGEHAIALAFGTARWLQYWGQQRFGFAPSY